MNGEEHQKIVLLQRVDEWPLGELQTYRHRPALKALSQLACPGVDGRREVRHDGQFPLLAVGRLQTNVVLGIGPVNSGEGRKFNVRFRLHWFAPAVLK